MIDLTNVKKIALVGASKNEKKFGYKILKNLKNKNFTVLPVSPNYDEIDGAEVYKSVEDLPKDTDLLVFVVPAKIGILEAKKAYNAGHKKLWFQPGAESQEIKDYVKSLNDIEYSFIDCIMVKT